MPSPSPWLHTYFMLHITCYNWRRSPGIYLTSQLSVFPPRFSVSIYSRDSEMLIYVVGQRQSLNPGILVPYFILVLSPLCANQTDANYNSNPKSYMLSDLCNKDSQDNTLIIFLFFFNYLISIIFFTKPAPS